MSTIMPKGSATKNHTGGKSESFTEELMIANADFLR